MILADTGYWVALFSRTDQHHRRALDVSATLKERLVTTWPVLTECTHLLAARGGVSSSGALRVLCRWPSCVSRSARASSS